MNATACERGAQFALNYTARNVKKEKIKLSLNSEKNALWIKKK